MGYGYNNCYCAVSLLQFEVHVYSTFPLEVAMVYFYVEALFTFKFTMTSGKCIFVGACVGVCVCVYYSCVTVVYGLALKQS